MPFVPHWIDPVTLQGIGAQLCRPKCEERAEVLCDQSGPPGATEQVCLPASASPGQDSYFEPSDAIR